MNEALDPLAASTAIVDTYRRYLGSLLPLRDEALLAGIDAALAVPGTITRGPLLEMTPPFQLGCSLEHLVQEGVLASGFPRLFSDVFPGGRPLFLHQEQAIRKASAGRNLVVATGTGSGKTESFLVPVLDHLVRESQAGGLGPGVRALLLYPMNALANDQLKRLRRLLAHTPEITFGRYTGDTLSAPGKARDAYRRQNGADPLPNELVSREEMQAAPPHILLTNYAMLEYLLLRPRDIALFEGDHGGHWKFVVVDEAHVYDGIKGAEIAMLLRRLRERVARTSDLRCLASSATVGDDAEKVARFGQSLFGMPFEWVEDDPSRQDVVRAARIAIAEAPTWGPLSASSIAELASIEDPDLWMASNADGPLEDEHSMHLLLRSLSQGPQPLEELGAAVFPGLHPAEARRAVVDLVAAGHRIHRVTGTPVLSARYHLFASAVEGAYTCFSPSGPHIRFSRHIICPECTAPMFELAACKRCGQLHLPGHVVRVDGEDHFESRPPKGSVGTTWLLLAEDSLAVDEDDDAHEGIPTEDDSLAAVLCTACGVLSGAESSRCSGCRSDQTLRHVIRQDGQRDLKWCHSCGGRSPRQIRRFFSGSDATAAVLASALYEFLPPDPAVTERGDGRRLLMFSDSRQQAAFAAPYLESTYGALLHRRLIARAIEQESGELLSGSDVVTATRRAAERAGVFGEHETNFAKRTQVATWFHREMLEGDERNSLEGTCLVRASFRRPNTAPPAPLLGAGLTADEAWDLLDQLVQTLRVQGAVAPVDDNVDLTSDVLAPRNRAVYVRSNQSDAKQAVLSWSPSSRARSNRRLDYLSRVLATAGAGAAPSIVLEGIWGFLTSRSGPGWLTRANDARRGPVWRVDPDALRWESVAANDVVWRCTVCHRTFPRSVRGVCPTNGCTGQLHAIGASPDSRDHYESLYRTMAVYPLRAEEHTAQLTSETASELQDQFVAGEVNVLSCSTTFELGVDVGELQCVLLRNVPPTTANYVQRAGRAGRRTGSAALVVTFAQMRSHDQSMFLRPDAMIQGTVRAPIVVDGNVRVDRRHAHSIAIAAFFREQSVLAGREFRTMSDFFDSDGNGPTGEAALREFLSPVPLEVVNALRAVLPQPVADEIGVETDAWVQDLVELVARTGDEYRVDVDFFKARLDEDVERQNFGGAHAIQRVLTTLRNQPLLSYLARRNVLPKYGFPVDTVELRVSGEVDRDTAALDLSRDLIVAINEYAPGSAIVARGKVIESAGVYRFPKRELVSRNYSLCQHCDHLEVSNDALDGECSMCGTARTGMRTSYVKPEFGFVAGRTIKRVGSSRPENRWLSRMFLTDHGKVADSGGAHTGIGAVTWRACTRATMFVLNESVNRSRFLICDWCGYSKPGYLAPATKREASHVRPLTGKDCSGPMRSRALAHDFQTDVLLLTVAEIASAEQARSVLYGLLAGAADALEISRDDIDGTVLPAEGNTLVLFDAVPAGAGLVRRIAENLGPVVDAMATRVADCDCGEETSCYRCLRVYRNQAFHSDLRRDHILALLTRPAHRPSE